MTWAMKCTTAFHTGITKLIMMHGTAKMGDDCILFSRSGCAGCQKWVGNFGGDQVSSFEGLNQAINGMLNLTSCGFSVWGTDIGGYGGPPTPEVYIRWLQFGTFNRLCAPTARA